MIELDLSQAQQLLDLFGGYDTLVTITQEEEGHAGPGVYAHYSEYPDEGSIRLIPKAD